MNIFILDQDPVKAAQLQCDKHVPKMVVESAQMLSTTHRMLDGHPTKKLSKSGKRMLTYYDLYLGADDLEAELLFYKDVHHNHPCTVWTRESKANYDWHWLHFKALCEEYKYRYGRYHATHDRLLFPLQHAPRNIPDIGMTPFKLAMKAYPECVFEDPIKSYRLFYRTKRDRFKMVWSKRDEPKWFNENADIYS
tara:strand:+ start:14 stop:595 length:582 start_codon:yes stop_codon:yes gene_type:complete